MLFVAINVIVVYLLVVSTCFHYLKGPGYVWMFLITISLFFSCLCVVGIETTDVRVKHPIVPPGLTVLIVFGDASSQMGRVAILANLYAHWVSSSCSVAPSPPPTSPPFPSGSLFRPATLLSPYSWCHNHCRMQPLRPANEEWACAEGRAFSLHWPMRSGHALRVWHFPWSYL